MACGWNLLYMFVAFNVYVWTDRKFAAEFWTLQHNIFSCDKGKECGKKPFMPLFTVVLILWRLMRFFELSSTFSFCIYHYFYFRFFLRFLIAILGLTGLILIAKSAFDWNKTDCKRGHGLIATQIKSNKLAREKEKKVGKKKGIQSMFTLSRLSFDLKKFKALNVSLSDTLTQNSTIRIGI